MPQLRNSIQRAKIDFGMQLNALFKGGNFAKHNKRAARKLAKKVVLGKVPHLNQGKKFHKRIKTFISENPNTFKALRKEHRKTLGKRNYKDLIKDMEHRMSDTAEARALHEEKLSAAKAAKKAAKPSKKDKKKKGKAESRVASAAGVESTSLPFSGSVLLESLASAASSHISHGVEGLSHPVKALMLKHAINLGEDVATSKMDPKTKKKYMRIAHPKSPKTRTGKFVADLSELGITTAGMTAASRLKKASMAKTIAAGVLSNVAGEVAGSKFGRSIDYYRRSKHAKKLARSRSR
jgi:hypothetical protein